VEFRSYEIADVALDPGVTVLPVPTAGKTNLLEAIGTWPARPAIGSRSMLRWSGPVLLEQ
jgi:recombinational DNA repair ATPase RecF